MTTITKRKTKIIEPTDDNNSYETTDTLSLSDLEARSRLINQTEELNEVDDVPDDLAFQSIINELGLNDDSGKVNVYKMEKGNYHDQIFLFECTPVEFNLTMLQNPEYHADGFHKFRVVLRNSKNIVKAKNISVMPNAKLFEKIEVLQSNNGNADILAAIKAMSDNTQSLIMAIHQSAQKVAVVEPKSTMEFLKEMQLMRDVMGINNAPAVVQPQQSPLEILELAKELALAMNPEANTGVMGVMGKMLEKYGEPIMNAIAAQPAQPPQEQPPRQIQRPPNNTTPNPLPPKVTETAPNLQTIQPAESPEDMNFMVKMFIGNLINQAARNADPDLYADVVLDQVGDDIYPLIEAPDWFDRLTAANPAVVPHKAWFEKLRTSLLIDDEPDDFVEGALTNNAIDDINEVKNELGIDLDATNNTDNVKTE